MHRSPFPGVMRPGVAAWIVAGWLALSRLPSRLRRQPSPDDSQHWQGHGGVHPVRSWSPLAGENWCVVDWLLAHGFGGLSVGDERVSPYRLRHHGGRLPAPARVGPDEARA